MIGPRKLLICPICCVVVIVMMLSLTSAGEDSEERFGMSEEAYERFVQEAERFGLTPRQLKQMIDSNLGQPLLYDRQRKFLVSWQSDPAGNPTTIHISPDATGSESVHVKYKLGSDGGRSAFTYSGAARPEAIADVVWRDLNTDGVFDQLLVASERNELLKLDRGAYILVEGQWVPAVREDGDVEHRMRRRDTDVVYRFDFDSARWISEQ